MMCADMCVPVGGGLVYKTKHFCLTHLLSSKKTLSDNLRATMRYDVNPLRWHSFLTGLGPMVRVRKIPPQTWGLWSWYNHLELFSLVFSTVLTMWPLFKKMMKRPVRADLRTARVDLMPERPDLSLGRPDLRPGRSNLTHKRPDMRGKQMTE